MWEYYRDNKAHLSADVRDHRDHILARLMAGDPVAQVFEPFLRQARRP